MIEKVECMHKCVCAKRRPFFFSFPIKKSIKKHLCFYFFVCHLFPLNYFTAPLSLSLSPLFSN